MSLREIVRRLGGDLYDGGRRANIPAPGHSRRDRSVSLLEQDGRVIVHAFGDGDWRTIRDHLRAEGLLDDAPTPRAPVLARRGRDRSDQIRRRATALALWDEGRPIARTLSERHLRLRGFIGEAPGPAVLRHHGLAPLSVYRPPGGLVRPALMMAIQDPAGAVSAVEITYLTSAGRRATGLRLPRKTVGVVTAGSAARLEPADQEMLVAEGLFTTLAARARFDLPAWALMSTSNLRFWRPPSGVRSVLVAGDRGADGEASAGHLVQALLTGGWSARVELPPPPFGDWDEFRAAQRDDETAGRLACARL